METKTSEKMAAAPAAKKAKKASVKGTRKWVVVENAEPRAFIEEWQEKDLPPEVVWCIGQLEIAPETKHEHAQCFFYFKNAKTLEATKKWFGEYHPHLIEANGDFDEQETYCTKEASRHPDNKSFNRGQKPKQGSRTDLAALALRIQEGATPKDVALENPAEFIRYHGGIRAYHQVINVPKVRPEPEILFIHGPPACGKTYYANEVFPDAFSVIDMKEGWFDGYAGEDTVIFEEFEGNYPLRSMLQLLDRTKLRLPVKGGFVVIKAHRFVFTTNHTPEELYGGNTAWISRLSPGRYKNTEIWDHVKLTEKLKELSEHDHDVPDVLKTWEIEDLPPTQVVEYEPTD